MSAFTPRDPAYAERVRESFGRQRLMATIGAELTSVAPGEITIEMPFREDLTQQHGFLHAATVTAIVDSACGYAASSLMPAEAAVLSIEFKMNMLAPAMGEHFIAIGRVTKAGRTITVVNGDCFAVQGGDKKLVATMVGTMMTVTGRGIAG